MPVALSLTLLLTGFACAYIAMSMVNSNIERGITLFIAMLIALKGSTWGLGIGILAYILLIGIDKSIHSPSEIQKETGS